MNLIINQDNEWKQMGEFKHKKMDNSVAWNKEFKNTSNKWKHTFALIDLEKFKNELLKYFTKP